MCGNGKKRRGSQGRTTVGQGDGRRQGSFTISWPRPAAPQVCRFERKYAGTGYEDGQSEGQLHLLLADLRPRLPCPPRFRAFASGSGSTGSQQPCSIDRNSSLHTQEFGPAAPV